MNLFCALGIKLGFKSSPALSEEPDETRKRTNTSLESAQKRVSDEAEKRSETKLDTKKTTYATTKSLHLL